MKTGWRALWPLLFALMWLQVGAQARAGQGTVRFSGREYTRLTDWAAANGLEARWSRRDEKLLLSNESSRLALTRDSREVQVNGVQVWLCYPVALSAGGLWAAQMDLETTLQPLVSAPRNRRGVKVATICLDPGHGGRDPGNQVGSYQEKKFTLALAKELREQLSRAGLKAVLTRSTDRFIELPDRPDLARRRKADLFVCLHFNSAVTARGSVRGAETYCLTPAGANSTNTQGEGGSTNWSPGNRNNAQNVFLAYQLQKSLTRGLGVEDRGVRRARFAVLREASMPGILIEAGFMSHPAEGRKIFTTEYRSQIARAIVDGLLAYKRAVERP